MKKIHYYCELFTSLLRGHLHRPLRALARRHDRQPYLREIERAGRSTPHSQFSGIFFQTWSNLFSLFVRSSSLCRAHRELTQAGRGPNWIGFSSCNSKNRLDLCSFESIAVRSSSVRNWGAIGRGLVRAPSQTDRDVLLTSWLSEGITEWSFGHLRSPAVIETLENDSIPPGTSAGLQISWCAWGYFWKEFGHELCFGRSTESPQKRAPIVDTVKHSAKIDKLNG